MPFKFHTEVHVCNLDIGKAILPSNDHWRTCMCACPMRSHRILISHIHTGPHVQYPLNIHAHNEKILFFLSTCKSKLMTVTSPGCDIYSHKRNLEMESNLTFPYKGVYMYTVINTCRSLHIYGDRVHAMCVHIW